MMPPRPALRHVILERPPYVGRRCENVFETLRHDADDRVVVAFKSDVAADNRRVGVESAPPQLIAENHNVGSVQPVVGRSQVAAEERPDSQYSKVSRAHALSFKPLRFIDAGHCWLPWLQYCKGIERAASFGKPSVHS